jgi:hypothetical protein
METLSQLFGSALRVKMMRLFLFNAEGIFDTEYIVGKTSSTPKEVEREAAFMKKTGLIKQTKLSKVVTVKKGKKTKEKKMKVRAWTLDRKFQFAEALAEFLVKTHSVEYRAMIKRLAKTGKIKAVLVSGVFLQNTDARLDMFVVGDNIKPGAMEKAVMGIESDMGKDIRYTVLSASDFAYRLDMNDRLVRDIFDFPHKVLLDKIGLPVKKA